MGFDEQLSELFVAGFCGNTPIGDGNNSSDVRLLDVKLLKGSTLKQRLEMGVCWLYKSLKFLGFITELLLIFVDFMFTLSLSIREENEPFYSVFLVSSYHFAN